MRQGHRSKRYGADAKLRAAAHRSREPPGLLEQEGELWPTQAARLRAFMANAHLAFEVTAPTAGVVEQVLVAKGQTVDAGQPLAR